MLRILLLAGFLFFGASAFAVTCKECMSQCPHATRDIKACDRGCPGICTKEEAALFKPRPPEVGPNSQACTSCMAQCPHATKDIKACDRGCPEVCGTSGAAADAAMNTCKACLGECPHKTKDIKACDRGCPEACSQETMFKLYKEAKTQAMGCGKGKGGEKSSTTR